MEQLRLESENTWIYSSSKTTKAALDALFGIIIGLRRVFEYPPAERLARAYVVLQQTPFKELLRAFRCPVIVGTEQDRVAARTATMRLRERFRAEFRRFVGALKEVCRADDIPVSKYLDNVDAENLEEGVEDKGVFADG